jgi:hypothetical protein
MSTGLHVARNPFCSVDIKTGSSAEHLVLSMRQTSRIAAPLFGSIILNRIHQNPNSRSKSRQIPKKYYWNYSIAGTGMFPHQSGTIQPLRTTSRADLSPNGAKTLQHSNPRPNFTPNRRLRQEKIPCIGDSPPRRIGAFSEP